MEIYKVLRSIIISYTRTNGFGKSSGSICPASIAMPRSADSALSVAEIDSLLLRLITVFVCRQCFRSS